MEAVPSSAAVDRVVRATNDNECGPPRSLASPDAAAAAAAAADWSGLPEDLLLIVMAALDVPSLICSGAVCTSWRDACNTFRLPALKQAPCLLYACDEYGPSHDALYCPSIDATFRVPFPGPPDENRGFVFSSHGWVFAADEVGNPYIFNPMTGVQATLPPVNTIMDRDKGYYDDEGKHVIEYKDDDGVPRRGFTWARHSEYVRVAIAPAPEVTACTVVIVHGSDRRLSFARPGDKGWTLLPGDIHYVSDVLYNDKDGLFYILHHRGSIRTLDLSGPSPSMATIMDHVVKGSLADLYLALMPSGELLQVWRMRDFMDKPLKHRLTHKDVRRVALQNRIKFNNEAGNNKFRNLQGDDDGDEADNDDQVSTTELLVFKVDIHRRKLVELRDIGAHAFFLGSNSAACLPVPNKDFPLLEPNCAYLTDDYSRYESYTYAFHPMLRKDLCIWNIRKRSTQNLVDAWPNLNSWRDLPAPIWITPRF